MGLIEDLSENRYYIEGICPVAIENNILSLKGDICYNYIPIGFIDDEYHKDIQYNDGEYISMSKYISPATYFTYTNPIPFNLFKRKIHLHSNVINVLQKYNISIYEVEIILGGRLKDMSINGKYHYSWECNKLKRIDNYTVNITIPDTIHIGKENICICSCYQPDKVYYITTEEEECP